MFTLQSHEIEANAEWIGKLLGLVRKPDWTTGEVLADLKNAKAQLWGMAGQDGVLGIWVTRIEERGVGVVWVVAGRGLREGLRQFHKVIEPWLFERCGRIEILGRKGWERVLPDYKREGALLVKYGL